MLVFASLCSNVEYVYDEKSAWKFNTYTSTVGTETSNTAVTYTYEYDHRSFITSVTGTDGSFVSYEYDEVGQLVRENNKDLGKTFVYLYNSAGNIESETIYTYTTSATPSSKYLLETNYYGYVRSANTTAQGVNPTWRDILMSYQNVIFTYDEIGNPLTYYNGTSYTFGWEGRRLTSATLGATSFSFTYNDEGIRTSKVVNGVEHTYILDGSQIAAEIWGSNILVYLYDSNGAPIGMQYRFAGTSYAWETYWFEKNLQGDIVAIYSNDGTKILSYTYDAWGNYEVEYHVSSNNVVHYNPFRYRGYYFDEDLGMYYLQSRYYDPAIGRFISPDSVDYLGADGDLTTYNLYDYCGNNPVMYDDPSGHIVFSALFSGALIGFAIGFITSVVEQSLSSDGEENNIDLLEALYDGAIGAINGALAASPINATMSIIAGAAIGGGSSVLEDLLFNDGKVDWVKAGVSTIVGLVSGVVSGPGADCKSGGSQVTKFINSRDVLDKTIENGTKHVISRQTNAMNKHINQLVISAGRYLGANAVSFMFNMH